MNYANYSVPEPPQDQDDGSIVNFRAVGNWSKFVMRSLSRRKRVVFLVALSVLALTVGALVVLPARYHVESQLLAQRNLVLALPGEESGTRSPSNAAAQTVLKRDNLVALVKETNLLHEWGQTRAPALLLKDWLVSAIMRPPTEAERIDDFVKYLRKQLSVVNDDSIGSVMIAVDWPDGRMAYHLVETAQRNFLEARHVEETSTIAESASILEGHAAQLRRDIDTAVREIQVLREKKQAERDAELPKPLRKKPVEDQEAPRVAAAPAAPTEPKLDDASLRRLSELPVVIDAKRGAVRELDGFRQRRLAELQAQLEEKRNSYTEKHPMILDLKQSIGAASRESQQVKNLRVELRALETEYQDLSGKAAPGDRPRAGGGRSRAAASSELPGDVIRIEQEPEEERDPEIEYARARLKHSIVSYQDLELKIQRARIDLDTAEAAFKYRYKTVLPPEIPKGPVSPKAPLVLAGALLAGLFLGMFSAVGLELKRGVLHEPWQVEQFLSLPVLASVESHELSSPVR